MMKYFRKIPLLAPVILCASLQLPAQAQVLTALNTSLRGKVHSEGRRNLKPLTDVLHAYETQYQVSFNYDSDMLGKIMANPEPVKQSAATVDKALIDLLQPLNLKFEKVSKDTYLILPVEEEKSQETADSEKAIKAVAITVSGKITGDNGDPLPGVSISLKGTALGTVTDADGNFNLSVPDGQENGTLVVSYIGFVTQEVPIQNRSVINLQLKTDTEALEEVVVIGYGTQTKESITGAVSGVTSKDLEAVHASTVSATLAGKIPGVSFRMPDGRPGASANVQIRNMGNPLFVIDGVQQDAGQFNNLSPNDIESITVLKDASAAIYGSRAANGVVIVTTKRGKNGNGNTISLDAYTGWQNWSRFPETVNAYEWMAGKADADMNQRGTTDITPAELEKWRAGTEPGYRSFDWYDFIIQPNSPLTSINVNATGGSDKINYYLSLTRLDQNSVLGREFTFGRTNIQSNIGAKITERLKIGVQINGRIETRDNPGVPGGDDYWQPRFALFRNRPTERPYANDNPAYVADIGHNETNWGILNKDISGYWTEDWRVLQANFDAEYELPIKGLTAKGLYSYYLADRLMNGHEYTYDAYTYNAQTDEYIRTGGSTNPWRERGTRKVFGTTLQGQLNYNNSFGKHNIGATFVAERIDRRILDVWVHAVPKTNALPIIQFADVDTYNDDDYEEARVGYVGRFTYNYADKYYFEVSGRRDASWKFAPEQRWGNFGSVSAGWRITEENFFKSLGLNSLTDLKLRASYGVLGDDNVGIGSFDYIVGYNYPAGVNIFDGTVVAGARQNRAVPTNNISWFTSKITDIGLDYGFLNSRISGSFDYFYRKRSGLFQNRYDVLVPSELGYTLPAENLRSDAQMGGEGSIAYSGEIGEVQFSVGGNASYSRHKNLESYKPTWGNSWDNYVNSAENRWAGTFWGYEIVGQFQSQDDINNYPVNIDGQGNKTLLPGDLIYNDINEDGKIDGYDVRPIGYARDQNPAVNFGLNFTAAYKGFDFRADFSGGGMYSYLPEWEMRIPYQNTGNLLKIFYDDRWHRQDPFNLDSPWVPGTYPALRFNEGGHSNVNRQSDFWLVNVKYLRARTIELGYSLPESLLSKVHIKRARIYINGYNLFAIDNVHQFGIEPEIMDTNGLQYPQNRFINLGANLSF
ncbi:SusC/RagA family TonB-linked outer membrane protein [Pontibacter rufus]|uniref:SusC/RagA family TonB-linked outer membrane protein n=1 Tax=Pontibacter rufus TaxID=2791028 RepID=UPI001E5EC887|nr:TonB-dependent receptor [Pontibacter sp. 172403-2]